ncbi:MAG TPA: FAD-binding protein [Candidatus Saccharimonadales bacterium]|nr:FAD-binding protein [Candidatus Saccharimonadales bacterium]
MSARAKPEKPASFTTELRARFGEQFSAHQPLGQYFSTKLGGTAEYLVTANAVADLIDATRLASQFRVPLAVVGGGSGMLASDIGFPGLVIINRSNRIMGDHQTSHIVVDSGVSTDRLLNVAAAQGLGGLEFLAAVPGTLGGAVATNAGFTGKHILGAVKELILFVPGGAAGQVISVSGSEIASPAFGRMFPDSIIETPVILSVRLQFSQIDQTEILRRLKTFRQARAPLLARPALGQVFVQNWPVELNDKAALNRWRKLGVHFDPTTGLIKRRHDRANAQVFRQVVSELKALAAGSGYPLDERLHFLGYWPDEGAAATDDGPSSANAESF